MWTKGPGAVFRFSVSPKAKMDGPSSSRFMGTGNWAMAEAVLAVWLSPSGCVCISGIRYRHGSDPDSGSNGSVSLVASISMSHASNFMDPLVIWPDTLQTAELVMIAAAEQV